MSFEFCPKCGANIGGAVACLHCGRMPTPDWPWRSKPPRRRRATSPSIEGKVRHVTSGGKTLPLKVRTTPPAPEVKAADDEVSP